MGEITYALPNFNDCAVDIGKGMSNFNPHFMMDTFIYLSVR